MVKKPQVLLEMFLVKFQLDVMVRYKLQVKRHSVHSCTQQSWQSTMPDIMETQKKIHITTSTKGRTIEIIGLIQEEIILKGFSMINPLKPELNPICYLLALGAHHFLHVSRIRVKLLTFRLLMSYIYGAPILDVSRSHTTTQHSR